MKQQEMNIRNDVALPLAFVYANNNYSRGTMLSTPLKMVGRTMGRRNKSARGKRRFRSTKRRR